MGQVFSLSKSMSFDQYECWVCGVPFAITFALRDAITRDHATLFCPRGCKLAFGDSEADKLRRELENAQRRLAAESMRAETNYKAREKAERALRKERKKASRGVCPVADCHRTFADLQRHMATKHADFAAPEAS